MRRNIIIFPHDKDGDDTDQDHEAAHHDEEPHVVVVLPDQETADNCSDQGSENRLRRQSCADASPVFVGHDIRRPGAEASR